MALSKRLQYVEMLRNPPANVPAELQATLDASVAAYRAMTKAKRKRLREDVRDEQVSGLPDKWKSAATKAANEDIANDGGVN